MEHTRSPKQRRRHRVVTTICILTLVISAALNISMIVLVLLHKFSRSHPVITADTRRIGQGSLCIPCEKHRSEERSLAYSEDADVVLLQGRRMCCLRHAEGLTHLVKLMSCYFFEHRELNSDSGRARHIHQGDVKASAHVFLNQVTFKGTHLVWSTKPGYGSAHVTGAIILEDNSLFIQKDGLYFVYSSLTFIVRRGDITRRHVTYSLLRHNPQYSPVPDILLLTNVSLPHGVGLFTATTLEESFSLRRGDVLSVHVSNYSYVYRFSSSNYFGVRQL
ncbi:uncharacterized protein LOC124282372 [Haliotis rubra]|uniref:uncharacterized protein LOC124282372 n=1 Tax=Haliotis rubra TaxID=36100 RepID=UPI001EE62C1E|nr:uncharacterized protein LOC124282372 [Haliotis rubra]